jgi:hypothetical protein
MNHFLIRFATISALLFGCNAGVQAQTPDVHIQVYGIHQGNDIIYNYKLINNSAETLQHFVIGSTYNSQKASEYPQLERKPSGWTYGRSGETGTEILLAPGSTRQPSNWTANLYGQQENDNYYLEWKTTPDGQGTAILPGQSLAGFSVTVPLYDANEFPPEYYNAGVSIPGWKENDMYLSSTFKVSYWDTSKNDLQNVWGPLERLDTTPPSLSVTLSPATLWPPNTITVKDDYDPQPVIKLVSITANEPLDKDDIKVGKLFTDIRQFKLKAEREGKNKAGRIYTVTYLAIDGSGNQSRATATVTVPHDQEQHENHDKDNKHESHGRDDKKDGQGLIRSPF